jgi:carbonic anhydrase
MPEPELAEGEAGSRLLSRGEGSCDRVPSVAPICQLLYVICSLMHTCSTLVICCIDFRFQEVIRTFLNKEVPGDYDLVSVAGACKNLVKENERDFLIKQLDISSRLHKINRVYLINHQDCGAYGEENFPDSQVEINHHLDDLKKSKDILHNLFPSLEEIKLFFIKLPDLDTKKALIEVMG